MSPHGLRDGGLLLSTQDQGIKSVSQMSHSVAAMHSDRKLRILVVANNYPPFHGGGYGLHCQWYAEELGRRGHTIQILTSRPNSSAVPEGSEGSLEVKRNLVQISDRTAAPLRLYRTHRNRLAVK